MNPRATRPTFRSACVLIAAASLSPVATALAQPESKPESFAQRLGYSIGLSVGRNLRNDAIEMDIDYVMRGLRDALEGNPSLLSDEEIRSTMQAMQSQLEQTRAVAGDEAKEEGVAFLVENGKRPEVTTTTSGLQYEVLQAGSGASPAVTDTVSVHYRGTLVDGTEFDSSYKRDQPATFPLNGVIPGWTEGLQLMSVGAKWKLFIPSQLGYGERGTPGGPIPPNATLIFEVELLEIQ